MSRCHLFSHLQAWLAAGACGRRRRRRREREKQSFARFLSVNWRKIRCLFRLARWSTSRARERLNPSTMLRTSFSSRCTNQKRIRLAFLSCVSTSLLVQPQRISFPLVCFFSFFFFFFLLLLLLERHSMFTYIQLEIKNDKYDDEKSEREECLCVNKEWKQKKKPQATQDGRRMWIADAWERTRARVAPEKEELLYLTFVFRVQHAKQSKTNECPIRLFSFTDTWEVTLIKKQKQLGPSAIVFHCRRSRVLFFFVVPIENRSIEWCAR